MRWYWTRLEETSGCFSLSMFLNTVYESDKDNDANYGALNEMSADTDHHDEDSDEDL